jgi:hypothetical protein
MLLVLNANHQSHLAVSWAGVDSKQEIEWFTQAFRKELGRLSQLFGQLPTLGWGLIYMWS